MKIYPDIGGYISGYSLINWVDKKPATEQNRFFLQCSHIGNRKFNTHIRVREGGGVRVRMLLVEQFI